MPIILLLIFIAGIGSPILVWYLARANREKKRFEIEVGRLTTELRAAVESANANYRAYETERTQRTEVEQSLQSYRIRFAPVMSVEDEVARLRQDRAGILSEIAGLRSELNALEDRAVSARVNLRTEYDWDAGEFAAALKTVREKQKEMAKAKTAATCSTSWSVGGSDKEGAKMIQRTLDLMLRAFNGECDSIMARARGGGETDGAAKIEKAANGVNRLGEKQMCSIAPEYIALKLGELHLVCSYQLALEKEREEQKAIREQMREEAKAQKEIEQAQKEAEVEERRFEKALALARKQMDGAAQQQKEELSAQIAALESQLAEAHQKMMRATSMAELTKTGHVYIISNIGSFGEEVFKVGMTRRLDPQERVDELGDASVPFRFDVHAMIRSNDAPALERALHQALDPYRVNKINLKKEFFRVPLDYIRQVAEHHHGEFRLTLAAEAAEFRRTVELLQAAVAE